jgi:HD-GYP domain-containing protein (c-di-GMP phosphodiesterase class II)
MGRDGPRWAAMGRDVALAELRAGAAKQFDPEVVRAFRGAGAEAPAGTGALAATRG